MNINSIKKEIIPIFIGMVIILVFSSSNLYSQCGMMKGHGSHSGHKMQNSESKDTTLIRKGKIDLESIDINTDGKVYQDQMDWNVISDSPGTCPLCGMTLKEVTIAMAKENLKKNGFIIK